MAFDTFDEGINLGGMRSKNEIKTLICYLYNSVKENMDKGIVIQAILKQGLANYFETSSAFDDLVMNGNLIPADDEHKTYSLTKTVLKLRNSLTVLLPIQLKKKRMRVRLSCLRKRKKKLKTKLIL